jgi:hypothetical protein
MTMRRPYQIAGGAFLLLALFVGWQALKMRFYSHLGPGPGFFPFWLATAFGVLAVVMIVQATVGAPESRPSGFAPDRSGILRVVAVAAALALTAALLEPLGFRLTMFAALAFLLVALGGQGWIVTALVASAGSFGAFLLFDRWLRVALPVGVFGF